MPSSIDVIPPSSDGSDGKLFLYWHDINYAIARLIFTMEDNHYKPHTIVGISRGGLIPAVLLSHLLDVPHVETYNMQLRDGKYVRGVIPNYNDSGYLVVDDLWDSGATMIEAGKLWPDALRATLFYKAPPKQQTLPPINFPGLKVGNRQWLVFPWENS